MSSKNTHADPSDFPFSISPKAYRHLKLSVSLDEAVIELSIDPTASLHQGVQLKLNSYDLGVDIELADAINRLRFEHPAVEAVLITSAHPQVFSSGANIYMLKGSSHSFKVNFCKYTNETRLHLEEASSLSGKSFLCALNGTAAGGGYELALACDRIILVDDKNANVSLPEVPLLGVLPGTGGLTRLTDKRKVRRDLADAFCTMAEGVKGKKAKEWGLVDEIYSKSEWDEAILQEMGRLKGKGLRPILGIRLSEINPVVDESGFSYKYVEVKLGKNRVAKVLLKGPEAEQPTGVEAMLEMGDDLWVLRAFRELDDAILRLRFFYRDHGLLEFCTEGDAERILRAEAPLYGARAENAHWFLRELLLHIGRTYRRIDVTSRTVMATIAHGAAFAGVLAELLFIADQTYALDDGEQRIWLSPMNRGLLPTWSDISRLKARLSGETGSEAVKCDNKPIDLKEAKARGLLTHLLEDIDFDDEVRLFKEERASLSPDALSAMEANLRSEGQETMATRIFGRLSAWQNWVFTRDNATGQKGALASYGEEHRPEFLWERC